MKTMIRIRRSELYLYEPGVTLEWRKEDERLVRHVSSYLGWIVVSFRGIVIEVLSIWQLKDDTLYSYYRYVNNCHEKEELSIRD